MVVFKEPWEVDLISRSLFWISAVKNGDVFVANVPYFSVPWKEVSVWGIPCTGCHSVTQSESCGMNRAPRVPHALVFSIRARWVPLHRHTGAALQCREEIHCQQVTRAGACLAPGPPG